MKLSGIVTRKNILTKPLIKNKFYNNNYAMTIGQMSSNQTTLRQKVNMYTAGARTVLSYSNNNNYCHELQATKGATPLSIITLMAAILSITTLSRTAKRLYYVRNGAK